MYWPIQLFFKFTYFLLIFLRFFKWYRGDIWWIWCCWLDKFWFGRIKVIYIWITFLPAFLSLGKINIINCSIYFSSRLGLWFDCTIWRFWGFLLIIFSHFCFFSLLLQYNSPFWKFVEISFSFEVVIRIMLFLLHRNLIFQLEMDSLQ